MESKIAKAIALKTNPVAVVFTNEKPEGAMEFIEGRWGCVSVLVGGAAKGRTSVFSRNTYGCNGGGVALGFGNLYENFPGGIEHFLAKGNKEFCESEEGKQIVSKMPVLAHGERYKKTPELAKASVDLLPITNIPYKYVVFKPLKELTEGETPEVVLFLANCDQLSALILLANYGRLGEDAVYTPSSAGCHSMCLIPYNEGKKENPRAVIGLIDTARKVNKDALSFAVPYKLYLEMENNVEESFLSLDTWINVFKRTIKD